MLVRTSSQFEVFAVDSSKALFSWPDSDPYAQPWWAPDSNRLLVLDQSGVNLVNVSKHAVTALGTAAPAEYDVAGRRGSGGIRPRAIPGARMVASSSWRPARGDTWLGKRFPAPSGSSRGLYVVSLPGEGGAGSPLISTAATMSLPAWSYADPSTTFLVGA